MSGKNKDPDEKLCEVSQQKISIKTGFQVFKYIVSVMFINGEKSKNLCKAGQNVEYKRRCKEAINEILTGIDYVYDNRETLYLPKKLDKDIEESITDQNLQITITFNSAFGFANVDETRTFLNMALNQYPLSQNEYSSVGKGEVYEVANDNSKEAEFFGKYGLVIRHGNSKGVHFINNGTEAILAMDYKKSVFYHGNASFLDVVKTCQSNRWSYDKINELYKNAKLQVKHRPWECFNFDNFTKENVSDLKVEKQTMVEYFRGKHGIHLDANYKAVQRNSNCIYPLETLVIVPDQKISKEKLSKLGIDKIKKLSASERYKAIKDQHQKMKFDNPIIKAFGINVSPEMIKAQYVQHSLPSVILGDGKQMTPKEDGSFQLSKCYETASIRNLYIFDCPKKWNNILRNQLQKMRISFNNIKCIQGPADITSFAQWKDKFANISSSKDYVIVVTKTQEIHDLLELLKIKTGIRIQHVLEETTEKYCIHNIVQKLNVRAGGFNWKLDYKSDKLDLNSTTRHKIVIAIDTCRPFTKSSNARNLIDKAACVGIAANSEKNPFGFNKSIFYQKAGQDIITSEMEAVEPELFYENITKILNGFSRDKEADIIYTRDGVSETQYGDVIDKEISVIKKAAEAYFGATKFKILALIATKSGNTRFFDTSQKGIINNLPPRSVVALGNRDIYEQFHVIPHHVKAGQGSAKALMVTVLLNEIDAKMEDIQTFVLALCSIHQSNCGPISLPAPIFLADEAAYIGHRMLTAYKKYFPEETEFNVTAPGFYKELTTAITKRLDANDQQKLQQQQTSSS